MAKSPKKVEADDAGPAASPSDAAADPVVAEIAVSEAREVAVEEPVSQVAAPPRRLVITSAGPAIPLEALNRSAERNRGENERDHAYHAARKALALAFNKKV